MHAVTVTGAGGFQVRFVRAEEETPTEEAGQAAEEGTATEEQPDEGPSPIAPEFNELLWGFGAFIVFVIIMRLWLVPKMRKGMAKRRDKIRTDLEQADATRAAAEAEVADYQATLAGVKAEAAARVDVVRQRLEAERAARLAEVNAQIGQRRADALAHAEAAKEQARASIESAVGAVAGRAVEVAVGRRPDPAALSRAVADVMNAGVAQ